MNTIHLGVILLNDSILFVQMTFKPENFWKKRGNPPEQDTCKPSSSFSIPFSQFQMPQHNQMELMMAQFH